VRDNPAPLHLVDFIEEIGKWSDSVFGVGKRSKGIVDHIHKELDEISANPHDLFEWVDVMILAFDGARREGYSPEAICNVLVRKHKINAARKWGPNTGEEKAIEHIRDEGAG